MRLRSLALALQVAATPVIGVVCAVDCDQPPAASAACHHARAPHDGVPALRGAPHACDHDHTGGSPALLTSAGARHSVGTSAAAPPPPLVAAILREAHAAAAGAMHGPPGLNARSTASHRTVLRI